MKKQRYRIHFSKTDQMRFTGHLDLILTWERVFRRANLPLAYSEGFSPRPLLNIAAPLPLGFTSTGELGDFWLSEIIPPDQFKNQIEKSLPPGLIIQSIELIPDIHGPKLPSLVIKTIYLITFSKPILDLKKRVDKLIDSSSFFWERKGKSFDLRPLISNLEVVKGSTEIIDDLSMTLVSLPSSTGRPDDVLAALKITDSVKQICRTEILLKEEAS